MDILQGLYDSVFGYVDPAVRGGVIVLILLAIGRVIPNKKLYAFFNGVGTWITLGLSNRKWWQKVEDFLINAIDVCWQGLVHGLRSDNSPENARNRDVEYAPKKAPK